MDAVEILGLMVPATYGFFALTEHVWPARDFPPRRGWQWTGLAFLVLGMAMGTIVPLLIPADWLDSHRMLDGTRLGVIGGALVGFVVIEGVIYAWHRSAHNVGFLWRGFHQIHHSPQRVDVPGSMIFHPLEFLVQTLLQLFTTVILLGLEPLAAALVGYFVGFCAIFQHWNVQTPVWIGYLIQRPESHCVHHRMGVHYYNYSDLPVWDILFGTFRNPPRYLGKCGFENGADLRIGSMLAGRDVNAPSYGPGNLGQRPA